MNIGGPRSGLCWPKGKKTEFCIEKGKYDRKPLGERKRQGIPRESVLADLSPGAGRITGSVKLTAYTASGEKIDYLTGFSGVLTNAIAHGKYSAPGAYVDGNIVAGTTDPSRVTLLNPMVKVRGRLQGANAMGTVTLTIPTSEGVEDFSMEYNLISMAGGDGGYVGVLGTRGIPPSTTGGKASPIDALKSMVEREGIDQTAQDRQDVYKETTGNDLSDEDAGKTAPTSTDTLLKIAIPVAAVVGAGGLAFTMLKGKKGKSA